MLATAGNIARRRRTERTKRPSSEVGAGEALAPRSKLAKPPISCGLRSDAIQWFISAAAPVREVAAHAETLHPNPRNWLGVGAAHKKTNCERKRKKPMTG